MKLAGHDAVVFDLDGTLIDTEPTYRAAFMAAARDVRWTVPERLYNSLVGIASPERAALLRAAGGPGFPLEAFFAAYYARRAAMLPARIPQRRGAAWLLSRLALPKAVATSASRRTATAHLRRACLAAHFAHVVTRDDVHRGKPAPDAFLRAADLLGVGASRCVAVDSAHGVQAARAAGMSVVLLADAPSAELRRCCLAVGRDFHDFAWLLTGQYPSRSEPAPTFIR